MTSPTLGIARARRPAPAQAQAPAHSSGRVMDLETMAARLQRELRRGLTLDAYLLAAGLAQIADDHLHAPAYLIGAAGRYLAAQDVPAARLAGGAATAIDRAAFAARSRRRAARRVVRWRRDLEPLLAALATAQVHERPATPAQRWASALEPAPAGLWSSVGRIPSCFAHFDQRPADVVALARRFAERWPDRGRRLLVVGVRTSGSYLGPLLAASLTANGYRAVSTATVRPGHHLLADERALIRQVAAQDGLALVIDDPPVTGGSVRDAVETVSRAGMPATAFVLALALFGAGELPPALGGYEAVLLAGTEWSVEHALEPGAVERVLEMLGDGCGRPSAEPVALPDRQPTRGHRRRLFRVRGFAGDEETARLVLVEGVGLGYLGVHRLATPALLRRFSPPVLDLRDGMLYREWLPDGHRLGAVSPSAEAAVARALADYVARRRDALACPRDLSPRMADERPAWLIASQVLSAGFGRAWPLARVLVSDRATRRLLSVARPSVVDGNTELSSWFQRDRTSAQLLKPDVGEDSYSNLTAPCFDAAFDLAGMTITTDSTTLPGRLRRAFFDLTGERVSEERWLLYELVHLFGWARTQPAQADRLSRARARAVQRYFAQTCLRGVTASPGGPLCALDVDGVLESHALGFPAATPAAALALRALLAHGYRPVLATGRSLDEAAERCRVYGLPGAVAEYGSVTFRAGDGRVRSLLDDRESAALARLRARLAEAGDVVVDPDYRSAVRAFTVRGGERIALTPGQTAHALTAAGGSIRAIAGDAQTDFVACSIDKARGLRALADELGVAHARPYALAVGDTKSDLPLVDVAARACAPAHADPALAEAGFDVMRSAYQAGLAEAVGGVVGHPPGGCARCRAPAQSAERVLLLSLLGAAERGRAGLLTTALELWWRTR